MTGDSGTGKTASFSFIKECMALNPDIVCLNYLDYQKNLCATKENLFELVSEKKGEQTVLRIEEYL